MFAQYSRIDVCRADTEMYGEQRAEPRGVEDGARPDHPFRRNTAPPGDCRDHDVDRICGHQENRVRRRPPAMPARSEKISVLRNSRLSPGLWLVQPQARPGARHQDQQTRSRGRGPDRQKALRPECRAPAQPPNPRCSRQAHPRTDAAHRHGISCGGADLSGSDDADFHDVPPPIDVGALSPHVG